MVDQQAQWSYSGMERRTYAKDWSKTPLGAMEEWPQSLLAALNICLVSESSSCVCWGRDFRLIFNEAWKNLFQEDPASVGLPAYKVFEDRWELLEPYFEEVLKNGEVKKTEKPFILPGKAEQSIELSFSPIYNESGSVEGIFIIAKISKAEKQIVHSGQELDDFFDNAPIGIHWLAADGTILKVNQTELDMLGYSREEFVGHKITEFYVNEEFITETLQKLKDGEEIHNYEGQMIHKDGSKRDISLSSNVYRENGEFVHTRCFTRDVTNQKRWERKLQEAESRYRTLVNNFPQGAVGLFDRDLRYMAVGGKLLGEVGVKQEDRVGSKITDLYPAEIIDEVKPYFQEVFEGKSNSFEAEFHDRHLLGHTLPIRDDQGNILSGMLVVQDITEYWQARLELRESEAIFRMMAENLNDIIWMVSEDGEEFIYINPAFEKVWGIDRQKLYDDTLYFLNLIHPEDRDRIQKRFSGPQNEFDDTYRIIRPDGEIRWLHARGSKVHDQNSQITRIVGIAEDITKRKHAEQQLRKSRNRLKTALDIETVGVIFWSGKDLTIKETNDAFLKMSGFSRDELAGKSWRKLTPAEFHTVSNKAVEDVQTIGHTEPYEKQYIRKDGSRWWGLFAPRLINETEAVEFVIDITERKEAQQKLEAVNETLEERVEERTKKLRSYQQQLRSLASQLNKAEEQERQRLATELHDSLGQMLALAKMKVEGLKHGQPSVSDIEDLSEVVDDALSYSQNLMVELKPPPALNYEDVREVLFWTVNRMEKQGLDITVEDDRRPKPVDEEYRNILHQSVRELFQNILRHAGTDKARIEISREKEYVKVIVEDKGNGFSIGESEPFDTGKGRFGLFNIKERLEWHGGAFEIHSVPGEGTKAVLYVPLKEEEKADKTRPDDKEIYSLPDKEEQEDETWHKIKILLVDDHEMVRRGFRQMIEKQDDMIILGEASHGKEAIKLAKETSPDIVIMDVNMPVMDGIEATQRIKREIPHVRIIGLSLHESQDVIENMHNAGASAYLTKNEAFESLVLTIRAESPGLNGSKKP